MIIYGRYTKNSYKNRFPENSFLISGISFYKKNCVNITKDTVLTMMFDLHNKYDPEAIAILNENKIIGFVPNTSVKMICKNKISECLKIIEIININGYYGIRVIPKCFYSYDYR